MNNAKVCVAFLTLLLLFFVFKTSVFAAAFAFSGTPDSISDDQSFSVNINLSVSGSSGNNYYLRGDFSHVDTPTSYFGYTKNNLGEWYNAEPTLDHTQLYKVIMQSDGTWVGSIEVKPDISNSKYKGTGNYNFKIRRYTSTGQSSTWAETVSQIAIVSSVAPTSYPTSSPTQAPTPTRTPTPTKTPTSTPTVKPTATPKIPTPTKTPIPTPSPIKSQPTAVLIASTVSESTQEALPTSILGESTESAENNLSPMNTPKITISPFAKETKVFENDTDNLSKILIGIGVIFLISCGILAFRGYMKNRKENNYSG